MRTREGRDALLCDFAETYHIVDYTALPARTAAALAVGLRESSRSMLRLRGAKASMDTQLRAAMVDKLNLLVWAQTRDGQKGRNRPKSVLRALLDGDGGDAPVCAFESGAAFEAARRRLTERNGREG